jgi:hypothetical protein
LLQKYKQGKTKGNNSGNLMIIKEIVTLSNGTSHGVQIRNINSVLLGSMLD